MKDLKDYLIKESCNIQSFLNNKDARKLFDCQEYFDEYDYEVGVLPNIPELIKNVRYILDSGKYWVTVGFIIPEDSLLDKFVPYDNPGSIYFDDYKSGWDSLSTTEKKKAIEILNGAGDEDENEDDGDEDEDEDY